VVASLVGSSLQHVHLQGAMLSDARLQATDLSDADLRGARFDGASLVAAKLEGTRIDGSSFQDAPLQGADFTSAEGRAVDLRHAYLWRTQWGDGSTLKDVRLDEKPSWLLVMDFLVLPADAGPPTETLTDLLSREIIEAIKQTPDRNRQKRMVFQMNYLKCSGNKGAAPCAPDAKLSSDAARWKALVEGARVADIASYERSLAEIFRTLVCGNDPSSRDILRGLLRELFARSPRRIDRISDLGSEAKEFISDLMDGTCETSPPLDDSDRAKLQSRR